MRKYYNNSVMSDENTMWNCDDPEWQEHNVMLWKVVWTES